MKKRLSIALMGLAAALPAAAADTAGIDKPAAAVGTSWRMRVIDGMTKAVISDTSYRISAANDSEVEISDESGQVAVVLDAAHYALKRHGERVFEPPLQRLRFPLAAGNRWDSAYAYNNPQCGPTQSRQSFKAVAWDDLTLPAGRFRALRIESDGQWRNGCGTGTQTHKQWIAPELGVPVRQESTIYAQGRIYSFEVHELQSLTRP